MTINYTSLLGLAKPVTGTETGQWGDVVNNEITSLLEDAVANAATISVTAGNVTLSTTNGSSNQARMATLIITGTPGTTRNVVAPSQAKIYVVVNQSDSSVVIKGAATTGITVAAGQTAQVVWNGTDFVEVGNYVHGNFIVNGNLTVKGNTTLGDAAGDSLTVNATVTSNLIFTDNTYDIGASGATRPRTVYAATSIFAPLMDATNLEVTNIKANDGTAAITITNSTGAVDMSTAVTMSATTQNIALGTSQTSGTFTVGGSAQTGTQTVGQSTKTHTLNIGAGATESAATKTINIGTGGVATSTTAIAIGSTNGTTITLNGTVNATTVNVTTLDLTNLEVTNIKAKDGTASMSIADSTGVVTATQGMVIDGLTVGQGAGNVATNTAVGVNALVANTTGARNTAVGFSALTSNQFGDDNTAFGRQALRSNISGSGNTGLGRDALDGNTTGSANTAVGLGSLNSNNGSNNTAVGYLALISNTTASNNTAVGYQASYNNTFASNNTVIGYQAAFTNTTGVENVVVGASAFVANTFGSYNTAIGRQALISNTTASNNTAVGYQALYSNTFGATNDAFGYRAAFSNTTGGGNVAVGRQSLSSNTFGSNNTAVGNGALVSNSTASNNTALGYLAAYTNTTGVHLVAVGTQALYSNTTGTFNTAVGGTESGGFTTLYSNTFGNFNTAVGNGALAKNTTASNNTAVGYQAGYSNTFGSVTAVGSGAGFANTTGQYNTYVGELAGRNASTANSNTAVGYNALRFSTAGGHTVVGESAMYANTTGTNNVAVGVSALVSNTTGSNNTALGYQASFLNVTGANNVAVGYQTLYYATGSSNTGVGYGAGASITTGAKNTILGAYSGNQGGLDIRTASNYIVLSDGDGNPRIISDGSGNVGIGTVSPGARLEVRASAGEIARFTTTDGYRLHVYANSTGNAGAGIQAQNTDLRLSAFDAATNIRFFTGNGSTETERARITSGGDFVVSSTGAPLTTGTKLTVSGSHTDWIAGVTNTNASPRGLFVGHNTDSNGTANWFLYCEAGGSTQRMSVRSNGGIANYQSNNVDLSDIRTKTDINPLGSYWNKIAALEIVTYKYKDQTHDDLNIGVIAQQVEQVAPEFVDPNGFGKETPEDGVPLKTIYNKDLTFAAIKALQEAMARIEKLEAEVAALKGV